MVEYRGRTQYRKYDEMQLLRRLVSSSRYSSWRVVCDWLCSSDALSRTVEMLQYCYYHCSQHDFLRRKE
jgi:hypothetical protein